jgi:hypothetical protein
MRHRNVWAGGLALGLGLCVVGITLGQEPAGSEGNWFTRLFARPAPRPAARKDAKEPVIVPVVSPRVVRAQAQADYLRRLEICDKLREIAFQNDDSELTHKADQLEQRAKDAFVQRTNGGAPGSFDEETLKGHFAKTNAPSLLSGGAKGTTGTGQASAEGRK